MAQTWVLPSQICHSRRGGEIRDKSVERENAAETRDKELWILQMRNRELQVGMTVGAGCWRLKQWFLALVTHWDRLLHCFFF